MIELMLGILALGLVVAGLVAVAVRSVYSGKGAQERLQMVEQAQQQLEALKSFRDGQATWALFRVGQTGLFAGIDTVPKVHCEFDAAKNCFHMEQRAVNGRLAWVPVAGALNDSSPAPGARYEIWADTASTGHDTRACRYDFEIHYALVGSDQSDVAPTSIKMRLVNLTHSAPAGACS